MRQRPTTDKLIPAYVPWDTFAEVIAHLKATAVTSRIDKSALPASMPPLTKGQIQSALRFLGLTESDGTTRNELRELVAAYQGAKWKEAVSKLIVSRYAGIVGQLDLEHATQQQLDDRFGDANVTGQMRLKSIRFYLSALTEAGQPFSPHLSARRRRPTPSKKRNGGGPQRLRAQLARSRSKVHQTRPDGTIAIPIPLPDSPQRAVIVPVDLSEADCDMIDTVLRAYAKRRMHSED